MRSYIYLLFPSLWGEGHDFHVREPLIEKVSMQYKDHKLMEQHSLCEEGTCLVKLSETTQSLSACSPLLFWKLCQFFEQTLFF